MLIRPAKTEDFVRLSLIRRQDGVRQYILAMSSEREESVKTFLESLTDRDVAVAAEQDGKAVGFAFAIASKEPKRTHSATVTVMIDKLVQNRGIGKKLLDALTDGTDAKGIHRLEAYTMTDNEGAIALYKGAGFEEEALRKSAAVREGELVDEYIFARIRPGEQKQ